MRRIKKNKLFINFLLGLFLGIIITILISIIFNFNDIKELFKNHKINYKLNKSSNNNSNYEFYKLLPKASHNINANANSNINNNIINKYYIQIAIFNNIKAADELKANLTLQGLEPITEISSIKKTTWYKVLLGPFTSDKIAKTTKRQLDSMGLTNSIIISKDGNL
jgi:hypothetical protein